MIVYNLHGFLQIRAGNCEGNIFPVVTAHGLDNDIHIDPVSGQEVEQPEGDSRFILYPKHRNSGCILIGRHAAH